MDIESLEVYSRDSNSAVVKPPGRQFPGSVIQGDSLRILSGLAANVARRIRDRSAQDDEFLGDLQELQHLLVERLLHYQEVLHAHDIKLPYAKPVTEADLVWLLAKSEDS